MSYLIKIPLHPSLRNEIEIMNEFEIMNNLVIIINFVNKASPS